MQTSCSDFVECSFFSVEEVDHAIVIMAAVGAEVTDFWFQSSGVISFFILLLLLSIFLTALCSECSRRSFQLQDQEQRNPSALIKVVKLEEVARENPMISEIQNDEKEFDRDEGNSFTPWRSHLGAPQHQDQTNGSVAVKTGSDRDAVDGSNPEAEKSVTFTPWRSHLREPQNTDLNSFTLPDSAHIYHTVGGRRSSGDVLSQPTDDEPGDESGAADLSNRDRNSVYAKVSKRVRTTSPPVLTPEVQVEEEEEEEEESSPPLPDRKSALEG
ncbi:uncharacterized protein si:ch73-204p21.2 isoform X1 [Thunnus albacares]|uniref:uncharacterized protein si:ch73-204p21.2 isoform X1 n=2 Tax=Thunnus albacares TaxID=8236 RepID=UPI001CF6D5C7|nr:uncharacterized protein si:ch73-204p21.2 isoform X1 [Thunnus albacares]